MNYNLFIIYWSSPVIERNIEILNTIEQNIKLNIFNTITIFTDHDSKKDLKEFKKVEIIVDSRKTYQDIFDYSNMFFSDDNNINVLANSDIEFNETITKIENINSNDFIALTRYNRKTLNIEKSYMNEVSDSQDTWIWKGTNKLTNCNFYLGVPGCDNRISFKAFDYGYDVRNPSKTIVTYHNHDTDSRPGSSKSNNMRVERPYCYLKPTELDEQYVIVTEELESKPFSFRIEENVWKTFKNKFGK
jgi:hypothetical protein